MPYNEGITPATQRFFEELRNKPVPEKPFWTLDEKQFIQIRDELSSGFRVLAGEPCTGVNIKRDSIVTNPDTKLIVTIITPEDRIGPLPTLIYFSGVGFTLNLDMH